MVVAMTLVRDRSRGGRGAIIVAVAMAMTVFGVIASDRGSTSVPALAAGGVPDEQVAANAVGVSTRYVPISPIRVVDTRTDPVQRRLGAGRSMSLAPVTQAVAAATGVAPGAVQAVVLNLTMVDVDGAGYASVWPTGSPMPTVSSANTDVAGQTVANMVTVPVGVDGFVSIFSSIGADYIVDVQGVYESATSASAGRFVSLTPRRAIDTRLSASLSPNSSITVDVAAVGVPVDASAAVLNVTATQTPRRRVPHRVARRHRHARRLEPQRAERRLHGRQPGDRPCDERTGQRVLVRGHRRHRRRHRLHDRGRGAGRVRRAVRADHPGPPARHAHTGAVQQRAADRLGRHADTADHRAGWSTGERRAGRSP